MLSARGRRRNPAAQDQDPAAGGRTRDDGWREGTAVRRVDSLVFQQEAHRERLVHGLPLAVIGGELNFHEV